MIGRIQRLDRRTAGIPRPISTVSEDFPSFNVYGYMAYSRGGFFFRMLSGVVGDENFRRILRTHYDRHRLSHVTEQSLRSVAEDVVGQDLGWFFDQWLHTTATLDYAVTGVEVEEIADGWSVRVEVTRTGEAWMPVSVALLEDGAPHSVMVFDARDITQTRRFIVKSLPDEVLIDPEGWTLDTNPTNDRRPIVAPHFGSSA